MIDDPSHAAARVVRLRARETFALRPHEALGFACVSGCLWVTLDHDLRDIVLEPGQSWIIPAQGRCMLYALEESEARLAATVPVHSAHPRTVQTASSRVGARRAVLAGA